MTPPDGSSDARWDDAMPAVYDRILGPALFAPYARHLAALAVPLAPHRVLEIAAGSGIVTAALTAALPDADVEATDLNPAMVELGARNVPAARWRVADAQALPTDDHSVDLAVCQFGAMFFPDRVGAYGEVRRVLVSGGTFLLAVWDTVERSTFDAEFTAALAEVFPADPPTFLSRVPHGYAEPERVEADLRAAGFAEVGVDRVELGSTVPSARALAEGFCQGTPVRFELLERGDPDALTEAVADALQRRVGDGPLTGTLSAWVAVARS